jgi:hypothetical protein
MMCAINPVTLVQMLSSLVFHTGLAMEALQCRARRFALRFSFLLCALPAGFKLIFDLFSAAFDFHIRSPPETDRLKRKQIPVHN